MFRSPIKVPPKDSLKKVQATVLFQKEEQKRTSRSKKSVTFRNRTTSKHSEEPSKCSDTGTLDRPHSDSSKASSRPRVQDVKGLAVLTEFIIQKDREIMLSLRVLQGLQPKSSAE